MDELSKREPRVGKKRNQNNDWVEVEKARLMRKEVKNVKWTNKGLTVWLSPGRPLVLV
jgi:hypothetical protein